MGARLTLFSQMNREIFHQTLEKTPSLESRLSSPQLHIDNIVANVALLRDGDFMYLDALSLALSGMIKWDVHKFVAAVLRIKDCISTTTCLVFRSGKMVVTGAKTLHHSIYACHLYRRIIEGVEAVYRLNHTLGLYNLLGRTHFLGWKVTNIVMSDTLTKRPDLKRIAQMLGDTAAWTPQVFPALRLLVWLRPKLSCRCQSDKKNRSCACTCKALIFDSGKIVIAGCKTTTEVRIGHDLVVDLCDEGEFQEQNLTFIPKHLRFNARKKKALDAIEFDCWQGTPENLFDTLMKYL